MDTINKLSKKLSEVSKHTTIDSPKRDDPTINIQSSGMLLLDPNVSQTKVGKREGKLKSGIKLS